MKTPHPITTPQDFTAHCGCKVRFDNDGFVRLEQCQLHSAAIELLEVLKRLVSEVDGYESMPRDSYTTIDESVIESAKAVLKKATGDA
jgi:hypothetical protein